MVQVIAITIVNYDRQTFIAQVTNEMTLEQISYHNLVEQMLLGTYFVR
jgi:hypothetical protein